VHAACKPGLVQSRPEKGLLASGPVSDSDDEDAAVAVREARSRLGEILGRLLVLSAAFKDLPVGAAPRPVLLEVERLRLLPIGDLSLKHRCDG
jgi:hypothetical protein